MSKLKAFGVPFLMFFIYIWLAILLRQFISDAVVITLLADAAIAVIGGVYYIKSVGDNRLVYKRQIFGVIAVAGCVVWLISSLTVTWLQQQSWCVSFAGGAGDVEVNPWLYILLTLVLAPISEEILFRGILLRHMRQVMPMAGAYLMSAIIFGLFHGNVSQFYVGFTCGIFFSLVYEYTGRLHISMCTHMMYNLIVLLMSGKLGLSETWFSPAVLLPLNILLAAGFLTCGILVDQSVRQRVGLGVSTGHDVRKKLVNLDTYSTVAGLCQLLMPGVNILVMGPDKVQLYLGPVSDIAAVPGLGQRQVAAGSMFAYCQSGDPSSMLVAFQVK